ncbi:MAG: hypothetical protein AAF629_21980 [Chloroflexota bacterium]
MTANNDSRPARRRRSALWGRIKTQEDATHIIHESRLAYYILAAVLIGMALYNQNNVWVDAIIYATLAFWLSQFQSRIAALLLLTMALIVFVGTFLALPGFLVQGRNALVGLFMVWTSARTVEATFKLASQSLPSENE